MKLGFFNENHKERVGDDVLMNFQKTLFLSIFLLFTFQSVYAVSLAEQFKQVGYVEICNKKPEAETFDSLYASFDDFIEFLQKNQVWAQKLYSVKERFIRSKDRDFYSTDFFGLYDDSEKEGRSQISFYYSPHFHAFICSHYPEFNQVPVITHFLEACYALQKPYEDLIEETAMELGLERIFTSKYSHPPILFKVIKYFPSYTGIKPHYDGTAFSFFLDSTDNESLLLSPYHPSLTVEDFATPLREFSNSILLIPGTLVTEYSINPTPHIVVRSGKIRYATIAFAMRPNYSPPKNEFFSLPGFARNF
jgi:hypothetical protein